MAALLPVVIYYTRKNMESGNIITTTVSLGNRSLQKWQAHFPKYFNEDGTPQSDTDKAIQMLFLKTG